MIILYRDVLHSMHVNLYRDFGRVGLGGSS